ncbi:MAG: pH regulation protein F [Spirochaetaceae bacterium]|nr:MAG: pH regulation protein F [Spirochaetaceae bacterium]
MVALTILLMASLVRIIIGPTIWDRLLGMNLVTTKIVMAIAVLAVLMERSFLIDVAIVYSLLGFIASILIARFIEKKGQV